MLGSYNVNKFTLAANNRPDIIIVEPLTTAKPQWKVFAIEVSSGDQKKDDQENKLKLEFATINNPKGEIQVGQPEGFAGLPIQGTFTWNGIDFS